MHDRLLSPPLLLQKTAMTATVMICTGSEADSKSMVASVRKAAENKAFIEAEKKGWTKYIAEGDLLQRNYIITQNGQQVAQVNIQHVPVDTNSTL